MLPEQNNGHTILTWVEAQKLLGVSNRTMYKIVDIRKELTPHKTTYLGEMRRRYFLKSDVLALLAKRNPFFQSE